MVTFVVAAVSEIASIFSFLFPERDKSVEVEAGRSGRRRGRGGGGGGHLVSELSKPQINKVGCTIDASTERERRGVTAAPFLPIEQYSYRLCSREGSRPVL